MASLAENGCTRPQLSTWQRIKQFIRDVLRRMRINVNLSDYDIAMLLYESKMNIGDRAITDEEQAELDRIRTIVADRIKKNETVGTRFGVRKMEDYNEGDFGPIYTQFENKPNEAIEYLKKVKKGEAVRALYHKSVGYIDIVWGSEGTGKSDGYGLAKLVKFHPEVVDRLQEIINEMDVVSRSENRVNLESDRYRAGIRLTWNDKKKTWLLTAYEKENSASNNRTDTDGTINDSRRNDTATPQDTVSIDKGTTNSPTDQTNSEENSENLQGGGNKLFSVEGDGEIEDVDLNLAEELTEEDAARYIEEWENEEIDGLVEENGFDKNNSLVKSVINATKSGVKKGINAMKPRNILEEWYDSRLVLRLFRNAINKVNGTIMRPAEDFFVMANDIASKSRGLTNKFRDEVGLKFTSTFADIVDNKIAKIFKQNGRERATAP